MNQDAIELSILDTAGNAEFRAVRDEKIRDREGFLVVFDVCNLKSFQEVDYLQSLIKAYHSSPEGAPCVLVGNKADLDGERKVTSEMGRLKAEQYGITYFETSALNGAEVSSAFFQLIVELKKRNDKKLMSAQIEH